MRTGLLSYFFSDARRRMGLMLGTLAIAGSLWVAVSYPGTLSLAVAAGVLTVLVAGAAAASIQTETVEVNSRKLSSFSDLPIVPLPEIKTILETAREDIFIAGTSLLSLIYRDTLSSTFPRRGVRIRIVLSDFDKSDRYTRHSLEVILSSLASSHASIVKLRTTPHQLASAIFVDYGETAFLQLNVGDSPDRLILRIDNRHVANRLLREYEELWSEGLPMDLDDKS